MREGEEAIVESEKRKREEEALYAAELERGAREERSREALQIIAACQRARQRELTDRTLLERSPNVSRRIIIGRT